MALQFELLPNCGAVTLSVYPKGSLRESLVKAEEANQHIFRGRQFTFVVKEHSAQASRFVDALSELIYDNFLEQEDLLRGVHEEQTRLTTQKALLNVAQRYPGRRYNVQESPFAEVNLVYDLDARFLIAKALHQFEFTEPTIAILVK